jgi:hypothetical protein
MNPVRVFLILALALGIAAPAQTNVEQAFSADRPGFAKSVSVLHPGMVQLEGGVTLSLDSDGDGRNRTMTFGSPMVRMGMWRFMELRAGGDGMQLVRSTDCNGHRTTTGWSDLVVGAKIAVVDEGRLVPAISLLPSISMPAGNRALSSSTYDPSLDLAWRKNLPGGMSMSGTLTGTSVSEEGVRRASWASAVSVGIPLPERLAGFVEMYAASSSYPGKGSTWVSDAGVSRNFGPNLQIDIEAGRRISYGSPCWFVATGFALRHSLFAR